MALKQKIGVVISNKMNKTIIILTNTRYKHKLYGKILIKIRRHFVHDPENISKIGDSVLIQEHSPISSKKHWVLKTILK